MPFSTFCSIYLTLMDHNEINIIKSQGGGKILLYEGYKYNLRKEYETVIFWRCHDKKFHAGCTFKDGKILKTNFHNHSQNFEKNEVDFIKFRAYVRSLSTTERDRDIVCSEP
ncbi:hypothetical protein DMUE_1686 [Dictyocoela muelleri]|nr:hypothetical protein DMUE_1686 [Dictyocoela muelleri]